MTAPESSAKYHEDPYNYMPFRIAWEGRLVAGFSKCSAANFEGGGYREGNDRHASRALPIPAQVNTTTLERGLTQDSEFDAWANLCHNRGGDPATSADSFRKELVIELVNEKAVVLVTFKAHRCFVSEYVSMRELDGSGASVAVERLVLQYESLERVDKVDGRE